MSSMDFGRHDALLSCIEAILVIVPSDVVKCSTSDLWIAKKKEVLPVRIELTTFGFLL
jgi:hypothetical protein